jgi:SpoVK/Ycf46/Vps4 family AAA+-type ATPase
MSEIHELTVIIESHVSLVVIETSDEKRVSNLFSEAAIKLTKPLYSWSITQGLARLDHGSNFLSTEETKEPEDLLKHIKMLSTPSVFLFLDFHPYITSPVNTRMVKEIALNYSNVPHTIVFVSHDFAIPGEIKNQAIQFDLAMPTDEKIEKIVREEANNWANDNPGQKVRTSSSSLELLVQNLRGVAANDVRRLARKAIYNDGQITPNDIPVVTKAKYEMLDMEGVLSFEYDTAKFSDVGGLKKLKHWLEQRKVAFQSNNSAIGLDSPKGIMLLGIQGGGKSLAAKSVAGTWGIPLLRLDFGSLYNKYHGETEKNLRQSLKIAEAMSPCVLWMDEIEKGITGDTDGPAGRVLGTLLTWMAEHKGDVFIVATSNDITNLPPELVRKGRLDEIFFVDLPDEEIRSIIFEIHLKKRQKNPSEFDLSQLAQASDSFSGAEIEQVVVSGLYAAHAKKQELNTEILLTEIDMTRPLSVVMAEKINQLRSWAASRTVPAN